MVAVEEAVLVGVNVGVMLGVEEMVTEAEGDDVAVNVGVAPVAEVVEISTKSNLAQFHWAASTAI